MAFTDGEASPSPTGHSYPGKIRTAWISDIHLGTRGANAGALLDFLRDYDFEVLYVVGDLIDIWQLRRGIYWPQQHNDVIQKILRKARKGTRVVYIPGNHDEMVAQFVGLYGNIVVENQVIHETADGRRILVIHGHELDTVVQNIKWLAVLGDVGYQFLLSLNPLINFFRRRFGLGYWSLSAYAKKRVKDAVSFIGRFEEEVVRYAANHKVDAVLCGHIHSAAIRTIGATTYYNCGDWVETCSALIEWPNGNIELVKYDPLAHRDATETLEPEAIPRTSSIEADVPAALALATSVPPQKIEARHSLVTKA
jgi:UDP-2,3-diacylglucosamine pyrophosphatase LpxH